MRAHLITGFAAAAFGAGLGATVPALLFPPNVVAQERPKVVEARMFLLVDGSGAKRAELAFNPGGEPRLTFYDQRGKVVWVAPGVRAVPLRQ